MLVSVALGLMLGIPTGILWAALVKRSHEGRPLTSRVFLEEIGKNRWESEPVHLRCGEWIRIEVNMGMSYDAEPYAIVRAAQKPPKNAPSVVLLENTPAR